MAVDEGDGLFDQLEDIFAEVDADETVVNLQFQPLVKLVERFNELDNWIIENEKVLHPDTQEARDAHSERNAIQLELRRRGFM